MLVIHGGPGFDHRYLRASLSGLQHDVEFVFYDQIGCGESALPGEVVGLGSTARQLARIIERLGERGPLNILAHSWGALVLAAACAEPEFQTQIRAVVSGGVLVNPVPVNRVDYDASYASFLARVPLQTQLLVQKIAAEIGDGPAVMRHLWPYYSLNTAHREPPEFPLHLPTYATVVASLGDFDFTTEFGFFERMALICGSDDFTSFEMITGLLDRCRRIEVLQDVGHFPMWERRDEWVNAFRRAID